MKAIEQYFHVVLLIILYKAVLTFKAVGEIPVRDHSNESYSAVLLYDPNSRFCSNNKSPHKSSK